MNSITNKKIVFSTPPPRSGIGDSASNPGEKNIASQRELLDFTKRNSKKEIRKNFFSSKIININVANISELTQLPGFGEKTAAALIDYRQKHGRIKFLNELLKVKVSAKET